MSGHYGWLDSWTFGTARIKVVMEDASGFTREKPYQLVLATTRVVDVI